MKTKTAFIVAVLACALAASAVATAAPSVRTQTWTNVPVVDQHGSRTFKNDPDTLTRTSAIKYASSGFGFWTKDGRYLKLDQGGDEAWLDLLKKSSKQDHLRANVTGRLKGDTIVVQLISLL